MLLKAFYDIVVLPRKHLAEEAFYTGEVGAVVFIEEFLSQGNLIETLSIQSFLVFNYTVFLYLSKDFRLYLCMIFGQSILKLNVYIPFYFYCDTLICIGLICTTNRNDDA